MDIVLTKLEIKCSDLTNRNRTQIFEHCLLFKSHAEFFQTFKKLSPDTTLSFWFGFDLECKAKDLKIEIITDSKTIEAFRIVYPWGIRSENLRECLEWEIMRQVHYELHRDQCEDLKCELDEPGYNDYHCPNQDNNRDCPDQSYEHINYQDEYDKLSHQVSRCPEKHSYLGRELFDRHMTSLQLYKDTSASVIKITLDQPAT